jgi:hypothetical protein
MLAVGCVVGGGDWLDQEIEMARGQSADNLPSLSIPGWPSVRVVELPLAGEWRARSSAASRKAASLLVSRPRRTSALVTRVVLPSPGRAWGHRLSQDGPQVGHLRLRLAVLVPCGLGAIERCG